jgi:hypothetical protein
MPNVGKAGSGLAHNGAAIGMGNDNDWTVNLFESLADHIGIIEKAESWAAAIRDAW